VLDLRRISCRLPGGVITHAVRLRASCPLSTLLEARFLARLSNATVVALAYLVGHMIVLQTDVACGVLVNGGAVHIPQFIRSVIAQDGVNPGEQVGSAGTGSLEMMFAMVQHLPVVEGGDLGIPVTSNPSIEKGSGLDQVGPLRSDG
jgi:hypothetical protein